MVNRWNNDDYNNCNNNSNCNNNGDLNTMEIRDSSINVDETCKIINKYWYYHNESSISTSRIECHITFVK